MRASINHINKWKFLIVYKAVSLLALSANNIKTGFVTTELISYNSN